MIKTFFILAVLFSSAPAFTCSVEIPASYIPAFLAPPVSGHYQKCSDIPSDQCLCVDSINPHYNDVVSDGNGGVMFVENSVKKAQYIASRAAASQLNAAMITAKKSQDCGKDTMAYLLVRNAQKNLTSSQVIQLVETYSTIKSLLESGSLNTAKTEISAAVADGIIITESDKTSLNSFIDGCKP